MRARTLRLALLGLALGSAVMVLAQDEPELRIRHPSRLRPSARGPEASEQVFDNNIPAGGKVWAPATEATAAAAGDADYVPIDAAAAAAAAAGEEAPLWRPSGEQGESLRRREEACVCYVRV